MTFEQWELTEDNQLRECARVRASDLIEPAEVEDLDELYQEALDLVDSWKRLAQLRGDMLEPATSRKLGLSFAKLCLEEVELAERLAVDEKPADAIVGGEVSA